MVTSHLKQSYRLTAFNCTMYAGVSSLLAAVVVVHRPLASEMVRLRGSLQSQPLTLGRRAGLVSGKAEAGMAKLRIAKLRAFSTILGALRRSPRTLPPRGTSAASWGLRQSGAALHTQVCVLR